MAKLIDFIFLSVDIDEYSRTLEVLEGVLWLVKFIGNICLIMSEPIPKSYKDNIVTHLKEGT
jgi:hypothetical protein